MVFPQTPLSFTVELWYDGGWQNITSDVRYSDKIQIQRGRRAESGRPEPSSCRLTLSNRTAKYSPDNPMSPLYGKIGRNTLLRVMVNGTGRFVGEVSTWPPQWTEGGRDVWVSIEASGILRRIDQRKSPLQSTLRRRITSSSSVLGYWPMEEDAGATSAYSPIPNVPPLRVSGFTFAADNSLAGSAALPSLSATASMQAIVPATTSTGAWTVACLFRFSAPPSVSTTLLEITTTGTAARTFRAELASGAVRLIALDPDGTPTTLFNFVNTQFFGSYVRLEITCAESGGNCTVHFGWVILDSNIGLGADTSTPGTSGAVTRVTSNFGPDAAGGNIGHLSVFSVATTAIYYNAERGFVGEEAPTRFTRLCGEEGISSVLLGSGGAAMGPQGTGRLLDLLYECADADGGMPYESRIELRLNYRVRTALYNQTPKLALDYKVHLVPGLQPVSDDQTIVNDMTVSRANGSSARYVQSTGTLSILDAPAGVGRYDQSSTVNVNTDDQLPDMASWLVHLGTVDEPRYPTIPLNLARNYSLATDVNALTVGDRITVTNTPAWLPPDGIDVIVQGWTETISSTDWAFTFVGSPASPWTVAVTDTPASWTDTDGAALGAAMTSTATSALVRTTAGPVWSTAGADVPVKLRVAGEVMTATAVSSFLKDAFARSVSSGWGTADTGQAWNRVGGGPATDYNVVSGYANQILSTLDVSRRTSVAALHPDSDMYAEITTSALATGDSLFGGITARMVDASNMYLARVEFTTGNAVILSIRKIIADVQTQLGTITLPFTHVAGQWVRIRFQVQGSTLRARGWLSGGPEPAVWQITATDTALTAAQQLGTRSIRSTGNTNAATVELRYRAVDVVNPQTFTVTRSVNGVVKAQAAGADVRLAVPPIVAL
ncbi:hypothetical protein AB0J38_25775 [Streptomyces sp. NPDC050095]|uniref:hypothetical protein n=1 Tax=unclassified Streptomyces TaxID=2593676 RepID=UPI0034202C0F